MQKAAYKAGSRTTLLCPKTMFLSVLARRTSIAREVPVRQHEGKTLKIECKVVFWEHERALLMLPLTLYTV